MTVTPSPSVASVGAAWRLPVVAIIACLLVAGGVMLAVIRELGQASGHQAEYSGGPVPAIHAAAQAGDRAGITRERARGVSADPELTQGERSSLGIAPLMFASDSCTVSPRRSPASREGHRTMDPPSGWGSRTTGTPRPAMQPALTSERPDAVCGPQGFAGVRADSPEVRTVSRVDPRLPPGARTDGASPIAHIASATASQNSRHV